MSLIFNQGWDARSRFGAADLGQAHTHTFMGHVPRQWQNPLDYVFTNLDVNRTDACHFGKF